MNSDNCHVFGFFSSCLRSSLLKKATKMTQRIRFLFLFDLSICIYWCLIFLQNGFSFSTYFSFFFVPTHNFILALYMYYKLYINSQLCSFFLLLQFVMKLLWWVKSNQIFFFHFRIDFSHR